VGHLTLWHFTDGWNKFLYAVKCVWFPRVTLCLILQFAVIVANDNVLFCSTWFMILSRSWEAAKWNCLQRNTSLVLFSCTSILSTCTSSFCHLTAIPANNCPVQVINSFLYAEVFCSHSLNGKIELNVPLWEWPYKVLLLLFVFWRRILCTGNRCRLKCKLVRYRNILHLVHLAV